MRLSNPVALLKSENTGEKPPKANWFFGLIGLLILLSAYYVAAVSQSPLEALIFFFIAVLMVIVATYLLLVSGSVTLCRMLRRNKRYYYQTRHFISVSAMAYRMKRNGAGMATICILCTMVLVILTSTVCLYGGTDSMVDAICPQDINLTIGLEARDGEENWKRLDAMQQMALDVTEEMGLTPENITSQRALVATGKVQNGDYGIITDADSLKANVLELTVYPLSVYEQATGETVTLADRELLYASFKTNETFSSMSFYGSAPYRMIRAEKELPKRLLSADYRSAWGCLVVFTNDAEAFRSEITALVGEKSGKAMMMDRLALHFDLDSEADTDTQEKLVKTLRSRSWEAMKSTGKEFYGMSSLNVDTRALCRRDYLSLFGGLFFLGMVLGPLFSNEIVKAVESDKFVVKELAHKERKKKAPMPFTTSTLQQEATHQFIVSDTGCGVPEEQRENIFKPFTEVKDLTLGDGLGLPICSLIATKMNGSLTLDTGYSKGARFVLELHA